MGKPKRSPICVIGVIKTILDIHPANAGFLEQRKEKTPPQFVDRHKARSTPSRRGSFFLFQNWRSSILNKNNCIHIYALTGIIAFTYTSPLHRAKEHVVIRLVIIFSKRDYYSGNTNTLSDLPFFVGNTVLLSCSAKKYVWYYRITFF